MQGRAWISGRRGAQSLLSAVLILAAAPGAATIVLPDSAPGSGAIVAGAAGAAGGDGPYSAGGTIVWDDAALLAPPPTAMTDADPVVAEADLAVMLVGGIGAIGAAAFVRRRHRRRIGWGVLPERSLFWPDDFGD